MRRDERTEIPLTFVKGERQMFTLVSPVTVMCRRFLRLAVLCKCSVSVPYLPSRSFHLLERLTDR